MLETAFEDVADEVIPGQRARGREPGAKKAPHTVVSWRLPRLASLKSLLATAPFGPVLRSFSTLIIGKVGGFVNGMNVTIPDIRTGALGFLPENSA